MNQSNDLLDALSPVVDGFRRLSIRHFIGGSVASSFHGAVRTTMDVDLVCELSTNQISPFIASLGTEYYVSEPAVRDAVQRKSCFNLIHLPTSFKVDVFISRGRQFDLDSMRRATLERLEEGHALKVPVATAEDSIISKLEWYQLGGETSERQWDDVTRLVKLLGEQADFDYLRNAADLVGVGELLNRLLHLS